MTLDRHSWQRHITKAEDALAKLKRDGHHAITAIHDRINEPDVYGTGNSEVAVHTSRGDSIVERVAGTTLGVTEQLDDLEEHARALIAVIADAHSICLPWLPHIDPDDKQAMRCSGGGDLQGALEWGRPDCTNITEPGRGTGLCSSCRGRRERWQRARANGTGTDRDYNPRET